MSYDIKEQFIERFTIELGLRPGYDADTKSYSVEDIKEWYMEWQRRRAENNEPYFAGIVAETFFVYAFKKDGKVIAMHEPSVRIEGEITKEYHGELFGDTEKILTILFQLAEELGMQAKQERVHVMFNNRFFILE
jgi:hypothetical protein